MLCLSSEFIANANCMKLFYLTNNSMQKAVQIVLLGADMNWMKTTEIGMQLSAEVLFLTFQLFVSDLRFDGNLEIDIHRILLFNELRLRELSLTTKLINNV